MRGSSLEMELAPLNARIEKTRRKQRALEEDLRGAEAELGRFAEDRQRYEALRDVCNALDRLGDLDAKDLFWDGVAPAHGPADHVDAVRSRIVRFEEEISGILENQQSLQGQIDQCADDLAILYDDVRAAYEREEERKEEYVIERDISPVPYRAMVMPWNQEAESERRFRRAVLVALLICLVFGTLIPMITVPMPEPSATVVEIPKRLVRLVKKETPPPAPIPKARPENAPDKPKDESKMAKSDTKKPRDAAKVPSKKKTSETPQKLAKQSASPKPGGGGGGTAAARKKAEAVGVLAFKDTFKDLMKETPVARLGTEARVTKESPRVAGRAVARRSLVSMQARGVSSGGIGDAGISRNIGNGNVDRLGGIGIGTGSGSGTGIGIGRVSSNIANLEESARPTSDGLPPGRTDEEIQIVFDRYKAVLYRIYNRELRKDPTLRGKMLMRIRIDPDGAVSLCRVEDTDLASAELVAKIVERIKRFNFGPKEGVQKITILYPIDFLPAG